MIIYAESNFVLELVLRQAQSGAAEEILRRAESRRVRLIVPTLALVEPIWTLNGHRLRRDKLIQGLQDEQSQFVRSEHRRAFAGDLSQAIGAFRNIYVEDVSKFQATVRRLRGIATILPLDAARVEESFDLGLDLELKEFDATILTCIFHHIRNDSSGESKCFVSKDTDFDQPEVHAALGSVGCEQVAGFQNLLTFLDRQ